MRGRAVHPRRVLLAALLTLPFLLAAAPAGASTIAWQCGAAVCAIDPDVEGATPRHLTPDGRFAGITRDGMTVAWVDAAGTLVKAPAAGGAPTPLGYPGTVSNQPAMSPDGQRFLWWYTGPDPFGGLGSVYIRRWTIGMPETEGLSHCVFCTTSHGWLGGTPLGAFPAERTSTRDDPSEVCRLATPAEEPTVRSSCVQRLVSDPRGGLSFPNGSPDGSEIVAAMSEGRQNAFKGRIVRYSIATGAPIADVTQGAEDTTPAYSADGRRIVFERGDQIVVADAAGGGERVIGAGVYPAWGGERTVPRPVAPPGGGGDGTGAGRGGSGRGGSAVLRFADGTTLSGLAARRLRVGLRCAAGCRVTVAVTVARATARSLGLPRGSSVLARASTSRRRAGAFTVRPRVAGGRTVAAKLRARRSALRVTVRAVVRPLGGRGRATTVRRALQLTR